MKVAILRNDAILERLENESFSFFHEELRREALRRMPRIREEDIGFLEGLRDSLPDSYHDDLDSLIARLEPAVR